MINYYTINYVYNHITELSKYRWQKLLKKINKNILTKHLTLYTNIGIIKLR